MFHLQEVLHGHPGVLRDLVVHLQLGLQSHDAGQVGRVLNQNKTKVLNLKKTSFRSFPRAAAAFYLPPVPEVYDVHVGLPDVPVQVLRAVLLLQVNGEGQLAVLARRLNTQAQT